MAGATGFLSSPEYDLLWTRYADGSTTSLGADFWHSRLSMSHGSVSDVLATEQGELGSDVDHGVKLRDMSTGATSFVTLGRFRDFVGAVGSTVPACPWSPAQGVDDCTQLQLLGIVDGAETDRTVTGIPADARDVRVESSAPGSVVLSYRALAGTDTEVHYAVVDLSSAAATPSHLAPSAWGRPALSPACLATVTSPMPPATGQLHLENRETGAVTQIDTHQHISSLLVGMVGDWALFGPKTTLDGGSTSDDFSFRAVPVAGGTSRKILDHATSLAASPDGALLVMGGTLAHGEGVYRVSAGADGAPVAELVAGTGQPLGITLVSSTVPAAAAVDTAPWKARWQLSRSTAEVVPTLRNAATGGSETSYLSPSDNTTEPVGMGYDGRVRLDWTGWTDSGWPR
ncbi:hypothetical protein [Actinacidiphila bryophytorum]|uniref:Uncharacterized protein n=1 Tax=Actinacidiphila bryophytorum TaxID=1436133 RepID=A0A9W4H409_9ACTN|nr:hypothetical protein [Actinacidiphila bryophytorum]MBM9435895.1 hypothetical protein [Actinacidiphila bryophytorum]MBN6544132.1 hypothetical protein [Actinacidiphila bryophytorum]CAG7649674.1 hypothetical protein SBRY_50162 [Actinacidiphila bryophytorum]